MSSGGNFTITGQGSTFTGGTYSATGAGSVLRVKGEFGGLTGGRIEGGAITINGDSTTRFVLDGGGLKDTAVSTLGSSVFEIAPVSCIHNPSSGREDICASNALDNLTLTGTLVTADSTTLLRNSFAHLSGTATFNNSTLSIEGPVAFSGNSAMLLNGSAIYSAGGGVAPTLLNAAGHAISGSNGSSINLAAHTLNNAGLIEAVGPPTAPALRSLLINTQTAVTNVNSGVLRARDGGILESYGKFDNSAGTLQVTGGGSLVFSGSALTNLSIDGKLTGGTYRVVAHPGQNSTLDISGSAITSKDEKSEGSL